MSEAGEITDDDFDVYVPVERPAATSANPVAAAGGEANDDDDDDEEEEAPPPAAVKLRRSSSESSLERIPPPLPKPPRDPAKKKKYSVWCGDADILSESLIDFGVDIEKKDRSVESYNYRLKYQRRDSQSSDLEDGMLDEQDEARRRRKCMSLRSKRNKNALLYPLILKDLSTTQDDPVEEVAKDITDCLGESNGELVRTVVSVLGQAKAIELFRKTKEIEKGGGMMILSQVRRRTSGGIFFFLIRGDCEVSEEDLSEIFNSQKSLSKVKLRKKRKRRVLKKVERETGDIEPGEIVDDGHDLSDHIPHSPEQPPLGNPPPSPATDIELTGAKNMVGESNDEHMDM